MKNKNGFTLIELLAVLVVLAIIALIAVPIVINIINDSRENSNKRSVEGYGKAVENAVAQFQIKSEDENLPDTISAYSIDTKGAIVICNDKIENIGSDIKLIGCRVMNKNGTQKSSSSYTYYKGQATSEDKQFDEDNYASNLNNNSSENSDNNNNNNNNNNSSNDNNNNNNSTENVVDTTDYNIEYNYSFTNYSTAVQYLLAISNSSEIQKYVSGTKSSHRMYMFEHPATGQTGALTDWRYIGSDPYNYVDFNGETWRIIGIFAVENENGILEQRIKLLRVSSGYKEWDSTNTNQNAWPTSTMNSILNNSLYRGMNSEYKKMIEKTKYYLGWFDYGSNNGNDMYYWERGTKKRKNHSLYEINYIGLMYPSDFVYASANGANYTCFEIGQDCRKQNWLYSASEEWLLSPSRGGDYIAAYRMYDYVASVSVREPNGYRPVVYLKSNVKIVGGDGTKDNHYQLAI